MYVLLLKLFVMKALLIALEEANILVKSCNPFTTKKERKKVGRNDKLKGKKYS